MVDKRNGLLHYGAVSQGLVAGFAKEEGVMMILASSIMKAAFGGVVRARIETLTAA